MNARLQFCRKSVSIVVGFFFLVSKDNALDYELISLLQRKLALSSARILSTTGGGCKNTTKEVIQPRPTKEVIQQKKRLYCCS